MNFQFFRNYPFIQLRQSDVATRAYYYWLNRNHSDWENPDTNWLLAENDEILLRLDLLFIPSGHDSPFLFHEHYLPIVNELIPNPSSRDNLRHLGIQNGKCAICLRTTEQGATFNNDAHIIPESFGNKELLSLNECDECNNTLGKQLEQQLASMFVLERAATGIHGKRSGTIKYKMGKSEDMRSSIGGGERNKSLVITKMFGDQSISFEHQRLTTGVETKPYKFKPLSALRSITKSAWLCMPLRWQTTLEHIRQWILGEFQCNHGMETLSYFIPGPGLRFTSISAWARSSENTELASLVVMFCFANYITVFSLPEDNGSQLNCPMPPIPKSMYPLQVSTIEKHKFDSDEKLETTRRFSLTSVRRQKMLFDKPARIYVITGKKKYNAILYTRTGKDQYTYIHKLRILSDPIVIVSIHYICDKPILRGSIYFDTNRIVGRSSIIADITQSFNNYGTLLHITNEQGEIVLDLTHIQAEGDLSRTTFR